MMLENQLIYEDEFIKVIYSHVNYTNLIITFTNMTVLAKDLRFYAEAPIKKLGISAIGFMAKKPNWYPQESVFAAFEMISKLIDKYEYIVGYGGSMGGYGALKYSKLLKMNRSIALDPQFSIDPSDIPNNRYRSHFDDDANFKMRIDRNDVTDQCEYFLIYDPYFPEDVIHIEAIKDQIDHAQIFQIKFASHSSTTIIANTEILNYLFFSKIDQLTFSSWIRKMKRKNSGYLNVLLKYVMDKNVDRAVNLLKHSNLPFNVLDNTVKRNILRWAFKKGEHQPELITKLDVKPEIRSKHLQSRYHNLIVYNLVLNRFENYTKKEFNDNPYLMRIPIIAGKIMYHNEGTTFVICHDAKTQECFLMREEEVNLDKDDYYMLEEDGDHYLIKTSKTLNYVSSPKNGNCAYTTKLIDDNYYKDVIY